MLFAKSNKSNSERMYRTVKNVEGATITTGMAVAMAIGASCDGIQATIANTAGDFSRFMGIATQDIANNDYGLIQNNGLVGSVLFSNAGTSVTVTKGDLLIPTLTGGFYSVAALIPSIISSGAVRIYAGATTPTLSAAAYGSAVIQVL